MNITAFNNELKIINKKSYQYGNEILYLMADPQFLTNQERLTGALWIIGRAYAASPQRRSYGTIKEDAGYVNAAGETLKTHPIWPVRSANDGREGFFDALAETLCKNSGYLNLFTTCTNVTEAYKYDCSENDLQKLTDSILSVLKFNLILSHTIETFDKVPSDHNFKNYNVFCSNHLSFSSKFLHFHFPERVFIIDNFAREGGNLLFGGKKDKKPLAFYEATSADKFDNTVFSAFPKEDVTQLYDKICGQKNVQIVLEVYEKRTRVPDSTSNDTSSAKDYIKHCIRSYLLGKHIKSHVCEAPINQIKYGGRALSSMPRWTDAILLNVKAPLSKAEEKHLASVTDIYKIIY